MLLRVRRKKNSTPPKIRAWVRSRGARNSAWVRLGISGALPDSSLSERAPSASSTSRFISARPWIRLRNSLTSERSSHLIRGSSPAIRQISGSVRNASVAIARTPSSRTAAADRPRGRPMRSRKSVKGARITPITSPRSIGARMSPPVLRMAKPSAAITRYAERCRTGSRGEVRLYRGEQRAPHAQGSRHERPDYGPSSDQWPWHRAARGVDPGNPAEQVVIQHFELPVCPPCRAAFAQVLQGLVGMDKREAQRFGQILLPVGQGHPAIVGEPQRGTAVMQADKRAGDASEPAHMPDDGEVFAQKVLFDRRQPGQVIGAFGTVAKQPPEVFAVEHAELHRGGRFDRMLHFLHDPGLKADEIAGQDEIDHLPFTGFQRLVA